MANPTSNFGWQMPTNTDLVKDLPSDFEVFGQAVDTDLADLKGGTTGQVLSKTSGTDLDFTWVTPTDQTPLTTKGDLFGYSTADARIPVGADGTVLTADSAESLGVKWASPSAGKVLQVVSATTSTNVSIASTTYTDSGLSASITPSASNSKVLVLVSQSCEVIRSAESQQQFVRLLRDSTTIYDQGNYGIQAIVTGSGTTTLIFGLSNPISYLDSPATTSSVTYKTQGKAGTTANSGSVNFQPVNYASSMVLLEIGA